MKFNPDHRRRSTRLKDYGYAQNGAYFITLYAHNRECLFGDIDDDGSCRALSSAKSSMTNGC